MVLAVNITLGASPENRFPRLAPLSTSRPLPAESSPSSLETSLGSLEETICLRARSHQRKAGMFELFPSKMPAWLAEVCEEVSVSQSASTWLPDSSQWARVGMAPSRIARSRTGLARPSNSRNSTPGTSVSIGFPRRLMRRRTALRYQELSSSMVSRLLRMVLMAVMPMEVKMAVPRLAT